jgi:hypothetical protein
LFLRIKYSICATYTYLFLLNFQLQKQSFHNTKYLLHKDARSPYYRLHFNNPEDLLHLFPHSWMSVTRAVIRVWFCADYPDRSLFGRASSRCSSVFFKRFHGTAQSSFPTELNFSSAISITSLISKLTFRFFFWDVLPCNIIVDRRFRGTFCLHHQGALMMGAARTSEMSVDNYFTR